MPATTRPALPLACLLMALSGATPAFAQAQATAAPTAVPGGPNEPSVKRHVVEDDNARIEELNVRGAVQSITVSPKGPLKTPYEVLPTDASRDPSDGPGSTKGAQGRRVWRVLSF
jgi:hypothetical protein